MRLSKDISMHPVQPSPFVDNCNKADTANGPSNDSESFGYQLQNGWSLLDGSGIDERP